MCQIYRLICACGSQQWVAKRISGICPANGQHCEASYCIIVGQPCPVDPSMWICEYCTAKKYNRAAPQLANGYADVQSMYEHFGPQSQFQRQADESQQAKAESGYLAPMGSVQKGSGNVRQALKYRPSPYLNHSSVAMGSKIAKKRAPRKMADKICSFPAPSKWFDTALTKVTTLGCGQPDDPHSQLTNWKWPSCKSNASSMEVAAHSHSSPYILPEELSPRSGRSIVDCLKSTASTQTLPHVQKEGLTTSTERGHISPSMTLARSWPPVYIQQEYSTLPSYSIGSSSQTVTDSLEASIYVRTRASQLSACGGSRERPAILSVEPRSNPPRTPTKVTQTYVVAENAEQLSTTHDGRVQDLHSASEDDLADVEMRLIAALRAELQ